MRKIIFILGFTVLALSSKEQIRFDIGGNGYYMTGQSYNETRGISVTVLKSLHITSMSLDSFCSGGNYGFIGARIYSDSTNSLLYSYDSIVSPVCYNSTITLPISYILNMGQSYRICFYCFGYGNNHNSGSATGYLPTFPYFENNGYFKINQAYSYYQDSFPKYWNLQIPLISLNFDTILPLKLLSFTTKLQQNSVALNWQTTNEINVSHINIQRSLNGKDFATIGKVNAACCEYGFTDDKFPSTGGVRGGLYYRLEIVDKDGSKTYSTIQQITIKPQTPNIALFPNPATSIVTIECAGAKEIMVVDYLGKTIITKKIFNNQYSIINVQEFAKGIYLVKVVLNNRETKTEKLVVE